VSFFEEQFGGFGPRFLPCEKRWKTLKSTWWISSKSSW